MSSCSLNPAATRGCRSGTARTRSRGACVSRRSAGRSRCRCARRSRLAPDADALPADDVAVLVLGGDLDVDLDADDRGDGAARVDGAVHGPLVPALEGVAGAFLSRVVLHGTNDGLAGADRGGGHGVLLRQGAGVKYPAAGGGGGAGWHAGPCYHRSFARDSLPSSTRPAL